MLAACFIAAIWATVGHAADESPWSEDIRSAARIVAGSGKSNDAQLRAGVEIKMQPDGSLLALSRRFWSSCFDFSGSEILAAASSAFTTPVH
jgi:hypothetical protein